MPGNRPRPAQERFPGGWSIDPTLGRLRTRLGASWAVFGFAGFPGDPVERRRGAGWDGSVGPSVAMRRSVLGDASVRPRRRIGSAGLGRVTRGSVSPPALPRGGAGGVCRALEPPLVPPWRSADCGGLAPSGRRARGPRGVPAGGRAGPLGPRVADSVVWAVWAVISSYLLRGFAGVNVLPPHRTGNAVLGRVRAAPEARFAGEARHFGTHSVIRGRRYTHYKPPRSQGFWVAPGGRRDQATISSWVESAGFPS